jgi:anti-sigma factor RsiW
MTDSDCSRIDALVTPYVDGELGGTERRLVDGHLERCPPCRSRVGAERVVHDLLRTQQPALRAGLAPSALRARCATASRSDAPVAWWRPRLVPLALAATLVMGVGSLVVYRVTQVSVRVMAAELAADHVKCFVMNDLLDTHQEPADVERAMAERFGWRARLPVQPERAGLELVGGRPCLYGEGLAAHVMYRHEGRPVSVYMVPRKQGRQEFLEVLGHQAAIWSEGERTFVLIARGSHAEVRRIADFVHAELR